MRCNDPIVKRGEQEGPAADWTAASDAAHQPFWENGGGALKVIPKCDGLLVTAENLDVAVAVDRTALVSHPREKVRCTTWAKKRHYLVLEAVLGLSRTTGAECLWEVSIQGSVASRTDLRFEGSYWGG